MPRIFVSGATGTSGGATVRALISRGADVVAGVRSLEKAGELESLGATVKPFDMSDVAAMTETMRGSEGLFLVTPVSERTAEMTRAMTAAAKAAGVRRIVKLSGLDIDIVPDLAMCRWHLDAEEAIKSSGLEWTFLRCNAFMQNFYNSAGSIREQGVYFSPFGNAPVAFVDAKDIGAAAAEALLAEGHAGRIHSITGPRGIINDEIAALLGEVAGREVTCVLVTGEQLRQTLVTHGIPESVAAATAELLEYIATGKAGYAAPDLEQILGRPPRDFVQWTRENAQVFRS